MSDDRTADLHLPWLELDAPAGSQLVEMRFWQREGAHHLPEVAGAALVELPDETLVFRIRHVRPGHDEPQRSFGGSGRVDYLDELEVLWLAFKHDATLTTADLGEALTVLAEIAETGAMGGQAS
jgi:hypothetical protein